MRRLVVLSLLAALLAPTAFGQVIEKGRTYRKLPSFSHVVKRLDQTLITVKWDDQPLDFVVKDLAMRTGLNFYVTPAAREAAEDTIDLELTRARALMVVRLLGEHFKLKFINRHGLIYITTPEGAIKQTAVLRLYDIRDMLYVPPDFPAPKIGIPIGPPSEEELEDAEPPAQKDPEFMIELIKKATGESNWENDSVSIDAYGGRLVVRHTPGMQRKVARFLARMRF